MGSPPTGLPAVVERRREHRVTGVGTRTDRRSLETRGPNATGSRQCDRGQVTQRLKRMEWREKKYERGLDNSGNIEGKIKYIFSSVSRVPPGAGCMAGYATGTSTTAPGCIVAGTVRT